MSQKRAAPKSRLRRSLLQHWSRRGDLRFGIAGRLGVAFAAVTVLATAANIIAEHGGQIIRVVTVAPFYRSAWSERPPQTAPTKQSGATATTDVAHEEVTENLLIEAIDQFGYAVERRANADGAGNADLLKTAAQRVEDQVEAYLKKVEAFGADVAVRSVIQRVYTLRAVGDEVVRRADERRAILADYWSRFESIDSQVNKALDENNWRIFGRVISRQSLLRLSRDLDDIRRQSIQLNVHDVDVAEPVMSLSQQRFRADLEDNAAGLGRSQGTAWLANLRQSCKELVEARERLSQIDGDTSRGLVLFGRSLAELETQVRSMTARLRKQAPKERVNVSPVLQDPAQSERPQGAQTSLVLSGPVSQDRAEPILAPSNPPAAAASTAAQSRDRALLASITGTVLLILLVIAVTTVRSIVVPIRRFMVTTDRLAKGDEAARFARGGIKELDALALSFNRIGRESCRSPGDQPGISECARVPRR